PGLTRLWCGNNQLAELELATVPGLTELDCSGNHLTELDLSPVSGLTELDCSGNHLTELDLSSVPNLAWLECDTGLRLRNAPAGLDIKFPVSSDKVPNAPAGLGHDPSFEADYPF
ncbi:MAG: hypothetical protein EOM92_17265, partial [Gammaproteobacteria bacterium]|nr:hypothetical protein [Gammaproteobacteria bacterium]